MLLLVPLLIVVVTTLANTVESLSFLLFPPLAAGTYTLFANPESKYASPTRFVSGLTVGALCGWAAMELGVLVSNGTVGGSVGPSGSLGVDAVTAGTAVFLTAAVTWALDVKEASAFSTALLGLLVPDGQTLAFVASVVVASTIVAAVFTVWRKQFYHQRARLLYESTDGGDHIIVPMVGESPNETAMLAGRLAAAHDAGKVVLLDFVSDNDIERAKHNLMRDLSSDDPGATDGGRGTGPVATDTRRTSADDSIDRTSVGDGPTVDSPVEGPLADQIAEGEADGKSTTDMAERRVAAEAAARLERRASVIESELDVPCQTVAATGRSMAATTRKVAHDTDCDLIAASYEERHGGLAPKFLELFECELDVVVHQSPDGRTEWSDVLVLVRRASDLAHSMLDSGARLAGKTGQLSVATCVDSDRQRRRAEEMLANLAETVERTVETRVSTTTVETFLERNASHFDIVIMGASMDRSGVSRFVSPPTFERVDDIDTDVVIIDRP
ncbi:HPP family protein [Halosegnis sp.]|uniref:HPP family protein n=1 Tax=Halosegnis sp. TaxID=2864959 RepID=UPI0035D49D81